MRTSHATSTDNQKHLTTVRCVKRIMPDGNCLFRSISYLLHRNEDNYNEVRQDIANHVVLNWSYYESFAVGLKTTYPEYVRSANQYKIFMSRNRTWGDQIELIAAAHTFQIRLHVFYDAVHFHMMGEEYDRTFALLYRGSKDHGHYNVVEDIRVPRSVEAKCQKRKRGEYTLSGLMSHKRRRERSPLSRIITYTKKRLKNAV